MIATLPMGLYRRFLKGTLLWGVTSEKVPRNLPPFGDKLPDKKEVDSIIQLVTYSHRFEIKVSVINEDIGIRGPKNQKSKFGRYSPLVFLYPVTFSFLRAARTVHIIYLLFKYPALKKDMCKHPRRDHCIYFCLACRRQYWCCLYS